MTITLRQLRYFRALAQERHFARAADRVAVSQPALSGQIAALETALGGPLLRRGVSGLPLTPLGRAVLAHAETALAEVGAIEALGRAGEAAAPLRLGLIPTVAPYLLADALPRLRAAGLVVSVREAVTATLVGELAEGRLDAAVIAGPVEAEGLVSRDLFRDPFLAALPPEGVAPGLAVPRRPEEIGPDRLLLLDEGHCLSAQALSACRLRRPAGVRDVSLGAAGLATLARIVASGQGITLLPALAAEAEGRGLRLARFAPPEPARDVVLAGLAGSDAAEWFAAVAEALAAAAHAVLARGPEVPGPAAP